ncbi:hypothetical protein [Nocardioides sp.]|uniref:PIN-like domain-containing protein n=1 Tax=Nocardioides sp. TaxID=35761 RepID=UPI002722C777|nr:hypothetical protein [Nocardioides sp.]MDO9458471.1 hypothetical protein [Nocardioides sp.]
MSSAPRPPLEFFLERSLGRLTADHLRSAGWTVHTIHELFDNQGEDLADEDWMEYGCSRGRICLTKDKRIRSRAHEIAALQSGHVFCLAHGILARAESTKRFIDALPAITRGTARHDVGFWHVHR